MKLGDLLRWKDDDDIGIVVGFQACGLPIVRWIGETHLHDFDYEDIDDAEVLNESRRLGKTPTGYVKRQ
jgi:hypothetical protein|tara:strand:+ start:2092 stop:2298 length:207 start_codon:yes stop_codon:yes gene_type:complete